MNKKGENDKTTQITHQLLHSLPYSLVWVNEQGKLMLANSQFEKLSGYSNDEIPNLSIHDIDPYASKISWMQTWANLREQLKADLQIELFTKSGKTKTIAVESFLDTSHTTPLACLIIKEGTAPASNQESRLWKVSSHLAGVGAWEWDINKKELTVTDELYHIFGLEQKANPLNADTFKTYLKLLSSGDGQLAELKEGIQNLLKETGQFEKELKVKNMQQQDIWVRVSIISEHDDKNCCRLIGSVRNIKPDKEREYNLHMAKTSLDSALEMVIWLNEEGKFIYVNEATTQNLGFSKQELYGMHVWDIAPGNPVDEWAPFWEELKKVKKMSLESIHKRKDGTTYPADLTLNLIEVEDSMFLCGIMRNIEKRKKRESQLQAAMEEVNKLQERLKADNTYLQDEISQQYNSEDIISQSPRYRKVLKQIYQVAPTHATVLILGETGTGKELLARAVHKVSERSDRPLVKVNCAALPENLIESELFGHEKGAFTGAYARKIGRFELADKGTIFLDEIGELPLDLQSKLLRVLQEGEIQRLGGLETIKVDVRVIAATNRQLMKQVENGNFREDLFYRLNVFPIDNIPLRDRKEDIPLLVTHFVKKFTSKIGREIKKVPQSAIDELMEYDFPGNIRELENIIERAVVLSPGNVLRIQGSIPKNTPKLKNKKVKTFDEMVRDHIVEALKATDWRVSGQFGAADLLGMNPKTLESKMRKYKIKRQDFMVK